MYFIKVWLDSSLEWTSTIWNLFAFRVIFHNKNWTATPCQNDTMKEPASFPFSQHQGKRTHAPRNKTYMMQWNGWVVTSDPARHVYGMSSYTNSQESWPYTRIDLYYGYCPKLCILGRTACLIPCLTHIWSKCFAKHIAWCVTRLDVREI